MKRHSLGFALATLVGLTIGGATAIAAPAEHSTSAVYRTWDPATGVGASSITRTASGITATLKSTGLTPGDAVTMWFVVVNNPAACASHPCTAEDVLFNPAAEGDFLLAAGNVIGGSGRGEFGGHLKVGDTAGSGFPEIGLPERAIGLTDPWNAEVHLILHSHGPAVPGQVLKSQLSSFTGGCAVFNGPLGFAAGPGDLPDAVGECSSFQFSVHL